MTAMGTHCAKICPNFEQNRAFFGVKKRGYNSLEAAPNKAFTELVPMASPMPLFSLAFMGTNTKKGGNPCL